VTGSFGAAKLRIEWIRIRHATQMPPNRP
jgi:hypothetical protein